MSDLTDAKAEANPRPGAWRRWILKLGGAYVLLELLAALLALWGVSLFV